MHEHRGAVRRDRLARVAPLVLLVAGLTAGCTGSSETATPSEATTPSATALAEVDLTGVVASRAPFCDALGDGAAAESLAAALDGEPRNSESYEPGRRALLAPGLRDVTQEFGCHFERGQRSARAWLFAQPVTAGQARVWLAERGRDRTCRAAGELSFGRPGLVQACKQGARRRVTAVGLFGDGWLTCQTSGPATVGESELLEATQRWCVDVARSTAP